MKRFKTAILSTALLSLATTAFADIEYSSKEYQEPKSGKMMQLADNTTITGTSAAGQKQTTIIDANGNLKLMPNSGGSQSSQAAGSLQGSAPVPTSGGTSKDQVAIPQTSQEEGGNVPAPNPNATNTMQSNVMPGQPLPDQTQAQVVDTMGNGNQLPQTNQPLPSQNQPMPQANQSMAMPNQQMPEQNQPMPGPNQSMPQQQGQTVVSPAQPQNAPSNSTGP